MARPGKTYFEVAKTIERLDQEGRSTSRDEIIKEIGGSATTISKYRKRYFEIREAPETFLSKSMTTLFSEAIKEAKRLAFSETQKIKESWYEREDELNQELASIQSENASLKTAIATSNEELDKHLTQLTESKELNAVLQAENNALLKEIKRLESQYQKAQHDAQNAWDRLDATRENHAKDIQDLRLEHKDTTTLLRNENIKLQQALDRVTDDNNGLQLALRDSNKLQSQYRTELKAAQVKLEQMTSFQEQANTLKQANAKLTKQHESLIRKHNTLEEDTQHLKSENQDLKDSVSACNEQCNTLHTSNIKLETELKLLKQLHNN